MTRPDSTARRSVGALLFGALFAVPALALLVLSVVPAVWQHLDSRAWTPVPAQVLEAGLAQSSSDGTTTYRVTARFAYSFGGVARTGGQPGWTSAADNIGDWHERVYRQLDAARRAQRPVTLWVDPADPDTAVYDRALRWKLIAFKLVFVLLFGGAGVAIMVYGAAKPPDVPAGMPPWLANPDWRDNRIRSNARTGLVAWWAISAFVALMTTPVLLVFPEELAKGNDKVWLALVLPAAGVVLVLTAIAKTLEWKRHGVTPLTLQPFPGEVGGRVAGYIDTRLSYGARPVGTATLACIHHYQQRAGGDSEMRETSVWQDTCDLGIEPGPLGTRLRFEFRPDAGLPASSDGAHSYHQWRLNVEVRSQGPDLDRTFSVPVFDREPGAVPARSAPARAARPAGASAPTAPPASVARIDVAADGLHLDYPLFRNLSGALALLVFGTVFVGCIPLWNWLTEGHIPLIFPFVFGSVGALLLFGGLYALGNSLHVRVGREGIVATRRVYGIPFETRVQAGDVAALEKTIGGQSRSGAKTRVNYRIEVRTRDRRRVCVGDGLTSARHADYVIERVRAQLPADARPAVEDGPAPLQRLVEGGADVEKRRRTLKFATNLVALAVFVYFMWDFVTVFLN